MTNIQRITTVNIPTTIDAGQKVYDRDGKDVGTVDMVERLQGYFTVRPAAFSDGRDPFGEKELYVPFRLIANIDPRELFLLVSRDELHRDYAAPPARFTMAIRNGDEEVAVTTETSGYTGAPVVVEQVRIDQLKQRIAVGDHVYTADLADLGTIKRYDPVTGWMLVERRMFAAKKDLMVPVTVVDEVHADTHEVYLAASEADLRGLQNAEPADVVFVESTFPKSEISNA